MVGEKTALRLSEKPALQVIEMEGFLSPRVERWKIEGERGRHKGPTGPRCEVTFSWFLPKKLGGEYVRKESHQPPLEAKEAKPISLHSKQKAKQTT